MSDDIYGQCTVIVARSGRADPEADLALLRATEAALGLPPQVLEREAGMDRPEFRLVEGIDRASADRVASAAVRAGFTPRVRDRLGIKYSSERTNPLGWLGIAAMLVTFTAMASVNDGFGPWMMGVLGVATVFAAVVFRRSIELPLVVAHGTLTAREGQGGPQADAELPAREIDAGVADGLRQARRALERMEAALGATDVPAPVRADLSGTHRALVERVDHLEAGVMGGEASSAAVQALRARFDDLRGRVDADPVELDQLATALAAEDAAHEKAASRRASTLADLLEIRRVVARAVDGLQRAPLAGDPAAALASQVEHLTGVSEEVAANRTAAAVAARAKARTE